MHHLLSRSALVALLASISAASAAAPALAADPPTRSDKAGPPIVQRGEPAPDDCEVDFFDSAGEMWDIDEWEGYVRDGSDDAYDWYGYASVGDPDSDNWDSYYNDSGDGCTYEEDGRELVMPADEVSFTNDDDQQVTLELQRKIYVPDEGPAFARWLDIVTNPGEESASFNYSWDGEYGEIADGDEGVRTVDSQSGDETIDIGESWGAFRHDYDDSSHVASLWDGIGGDGWDFPYENDEEYIPGQDGGSDYAEFIYDTDTLAPGESVVYMHVEHQNTVDFDPENDRGSQTSDEDEAAFEEAAAFAREHERGSNELYGAMSADELTALRNWNPDSDGDGVLQFEDNCEEAANPDQADMDADGEGDACDDDIDGDGLTNEQEERLGMNPRNADSDGDGKADGVDRCPTRAGAEADGCAAPTTQQSQQQSQQPPQVIVQSQILQRLRARRLTANVSRKRTERGLRVRTSGRLLLPAGVSAEQGCNGSVLVIVKSRKRTVSTRKAKLSKTCRYRSKVTFTLPGRLADRQLEVFATFQGNSRIYRQRAKSSTVGRP